MERMLLPFLLGSEEEKRGLKLLVRNADQILPKKQLKQGGKMTAEIAIINQQGIALAADSAVTIGRKRVWKTANKLFSLSPYNDIGIMIYGSGSFSGLPWETVVKCFRHHIGPQKFSTLQNCADSFIEYLKTDITNEKGEGIGTILVFLRQINDIKKHVGEWETKAEFKKKASPFIDAQIKRYEKEKIILNDFTYQIFIANFGALISEIIKEELEKEVPTKKLEKAISKLFYEAYRREIPSNYETGLVIAGFGEKEFLPSLLHYTIDGKHKNLVRAWPVNNGHDVNSEQGAAIIPFAQTDMFQLFLEGIAPQYVKFMRSFLINSLHEKSNRMIDSYVSADKKTEEAQKQRQENTMIIEQFGDEFVNYKGKTTNQIMEVVNSLPKEEMAVLAEALVELTSLRRKMDSNLESVGGATDVAVISKGDGFVWIKRKHYFDPKLNLDFLRRKEVQINQKEGAAT